MLRRNRDRGSVGLQRMRIGIITGVAAISIAAGIGIVASPVFATTDCGGVETSIIGGDICNGANVKSTDSADSPVISVLTFVMKIMVGAAGVAAVGALIYAGILYSAAGGEAGQVQKAKTVIRDTIIGIVCFAGMIVILNFVIPGGVFGQQGTTGGGTAADPGGSGDTPGNTYTPVAGACYWKDTKTQPGGNLYHRSGSVPYAFENSPQGIAYASKHGYGRIDLDIQITKDGVPVVTHTADPLRKDVIWAGFTDTSGKIKNKKTYVKDLTYAQISQFVHKEGYKIYSLKYMIGVAAKTKLSLYLELKTPALLKSHLPEIAAMLNNEHVEAIIAGQTTSAHPGQLSALAYARQLGFWTRNITAGTWSKPNKDNSLCKKLEG